MSKILKLGTRGSELALYQTEWVKARLTEIFPDIRFETEIIKTTGDIILDSPLSQIGDKGLFTKELDRALLDGRIDIAVHSMKDVPTQFNEELAIIAITERWDVRDAFLSKTVSAISDLPEGATVATGSLRRKAQLLHQRPDLNIIDIRGNINTRLKKFDENNWDGMILAIAGLERLNFHDRITERISTETMLPAVGQGCFAVMGRANDKDTANLLSKLNAPEVEAAVRAERALLRKLEGGCQVPLGAYATVRDGQLNLEGVVASLDGSEYYRSEVDGDISDPEALGYLIAEKLITQGADRVLAEIREQEGNA